MALLCNPVCMFIRKIQCQQKKSGGHYFTYRIVKSQRIGTKVHQYILLNLGVDFSISKKHWSILTNRIQEILSGQQPLFIIDTSLDKAAHNYAQKILTAKQDDEAKGRNDYRTVNIDTLNIYNPRTIGCEHVTLETLRFLKLDKKLADLGFSPPQVALSIGAIVGRACHPAVNAKHIDGSRIKPVLVN